MRSHTRTIRRAALAGVLLLTLAVLGCPKHENFPSALDLVVPPTPDTFVITYVGPNVNGGFDYDLSWSITDPAVVDHYRLYLDTGAPVLELVAETANTSLPTIFPFRITGLRLSVSAVSTGNVEGEARSKVAP